MGPALTTDWHPALSAGGATGSPTSAMALPGDLAVSRAVTAPWPSSWPRTSCSRSASGSTCCCPRWSMPGDALPLAVSAASFFDVCFIFYVIYLCSSVISSDIMFVSWFAIRLSLECDQGRNCVYFICCYTCYILCLELCMAHSSCSINWLD